MYYCVLLHVCFFISFHVILCYPLGLTQEVSGLSFISFMYYCVLKALGHAIRADCLLNLKMDAITPHSLTQ